MPSERDLCKYSAKFKSREALEAIREQKTLAELATPTQLPLGIMKVNLHCTRLLAELSKEYEVSVNQISLWKQEAIKNMDMLFGGDRSRREIKEMSTQIKDLRTKVGELTMERDFFEQACKMVSRKKNAGSL